MLTDAQISDYSRSLKSLAGDPANSIAVTIGNELLRELKSARSIITKIVDATDCDCAESGDVTPAQQEDMIDAAMADARKMIGKPQPKDDDGAQEDAMD